MLWRHRLPPVVLSLLLCLWVETGHAQIYRCGNTYSETPCANAQRLHATPLSGKEDDPASSARRTQQHEKKRAKEKEHTMRALRQASANGADNCQALERRIDKIDQLARRGGSVTKMEQLRADRQATRDKQFRLGC